MGPLKSIIVFDERPPDTDGSGDVLHLNETWREKAMRLADFTDPNPEVDQYRFCTHLSEESCSECIIHCPPGALGNSSPRSDGRYTERVASQTHRFWDGALHFDYTSCCDERGQMAKLYDEWFCGRCLCMCAHAGHRRQWAAENFDALLFGDTSLAD